MPIVAAVTSRPSRIGLSQLRQFRGRLEAAGDTISGLTGSSSDGFIVYRTIADCRLHKVNLQSAIYNHLRPLRRNTSTIPATITSATAAPTIKAPLPLAPLGALLAAGGCSSGTCPGDGITDVATLALYGCSDVAAAAAAGGCGAVVVSSAAPAGGAALVGAVPSAAAPAPLVSARAVRASAGIGVAAGVTVAAAAAIGAWAAAGAAVGSAAAIGAAGASAAAAAGGAGGAGRPG